MEEVRKLMALLKCSEEEALDVIAYDKAVDRSKPKDEPLAHDLPKAKEKEALREAHKGTDKKKPNYTFTKRERKPNEKKREIIEIAAKALCEHGIAAEASNAERELVFTVEGVSYSLTLTAHRAKA